MPIYDFRCSSCGEVFEVMVSVSERPPCPACAASEPERLFSPIAAPPKTGLRGLAARRSNDTRRVREELRQDGFRKQRERLGLPPRKAE
jgi:putative FmdB family regulatory protein